MAKLQRKTQKIFSSDSATNEHAVFGTMKNIVNNEQPQYSMDVEALQSNAAFLLGWQNAVVAGFAPFLEEMNSVFYLITSQLAYLLNNGVAEYDANTTYYIGDIVKVITNNIPVLKYSVTDENLGNNTDDTNYWRNYTAGSISSSGVPDIVIVGSPTIQEGQVSNFSINDYVQYPIIFNPQNDTWEINSCFITGSQLTAQQNVLDSTYGVAFAIINNRFVISLSSNGTSWDIAEGETGTVEIETGTTYYIKLTFDGTQYKLSYSIDNETFTDDITVTSSSVINPANLLFSGNAHPFDGSFILNYWNILINGIEVWTGIDDVGLSTKANLDLNNLSSAGESRVLGAPIPNIARYGELEYNAHNGTLSGFSAYNYGLITLKNTTNAAASFDIQFKINTGSYFSDYGRVINALGGVDSPNGLFLMVSLNDIRLVFYNGTTYMPIPTVSNPKLNTDYTMRWVYDGTAIKAYSAEGDGELSLYQTVTPEYTPHFTTANYALGVRYDDKATESIFPGIIYLPECSINVNGAVWWEGTYGQTRDNVADRDLRNLSEAGEAKLINHFMPDYSKGISLSTVPVVDSPFTAPADGWFMCGVEPPVSSVFFVNINGVRTTLKSSNSNLYTSMGTSTIPLGKDDVIYWEITQGQKPNTISKCGFYPMKGA